MARGGMRGAYKHEDEPAPAPVTLPRGRPGQRVVDEPPRRGPPAGRKHDKVVIARRRLIGLLHKRELESLSGLPRAFERDKEELIGAVMDNWNGEVNRTLEQAFKAMVARSNEQPRNDD